MAGVNVSDPRQCLGPARRRRRRALAGLGALALLAAPACGSSGEDRPLQTLRFGLIQSSDFLPLFVMQEQGFAGRHGLRLVEEVVAGGVASIEAMAGGTLDAGYIGTFPALLAAGNGLIPRDVIGVGGHAFADPAHPAFAVLVGPDVRGWGDLAGRDIAVNQPGSIGGVAVRLRLEAEGVTGARLLSVPFPNQGLAVAGGNVAAAVLVEPFVTQSVLRGDGRVLDWIVGGGQPFPEFQFGLLAVRTQLLREQPDTVRALLAAQLDAVRWIAGHEDEARAILGRRLGVTDEVARRMVLVRFNTDARNNPSQLATIQDRLLSLDPSQRAVAVTSLYDESLLDQVLKERKG